MTTITDLETDQITPLPRVTRVEIIDHSPEGTGRDWSKWHLNEVMVSIQDQGRTLKVFVK